VNTRYVYLSYPSGTTSAVVSYYFDDCNYANYGNTSYMWFAWNYGASASYNTYNSVYI